MRWSLHSAFPSSVTDHIVSRPLCDLSIGQWTQLVQLVGGGETVLLVLVLPLSLEHLRGGAAVRRKGDVYAGAEVRSRLGTVFYHTIVEECRNSRTHPDRMAKNHLLLLLMEEIIVRRSVLLALLAVNAGAEVVVVAGACHIVPLGEYSRWARFKRELIVPFSAFDHPSWSAVYRSLEFVHQQMDLRWFMRADERVEGFGRWVQVMCTPGIGSRLAAFLPKQNQWFPGSRARVGDVSPTTLLQDSHLRGALWQALGAAFAVMGESLKAGRQLLCSAPPLVEIRRQIGRVDSSCWREPSGVTHGVAGLLVPVEGVPAVMSLMSVMRRSSGLNPGAQMTLAAQAAPAPAAPEVAHGAPVSPVVQVARVTSGDAASRGVSADAEDEIARFLRDGRVRAQERQLEEARSAQERKRWVAAAGCYEEAISKSPQAAQFAQDCMDIATEDSGWGVSRAIAAAESKRDADCERRARVDRYCSFYAENTEDASLI